MTAIIPSTPSVAAVVLKIALPCPLWRSFDYLPPLEVDPQVLKPGTRVRVPWGKSNSVRVGYLVEIARCETERLDSLKRAFSILDSEALLSTDDCEIIFWASRYYHHPIGEVFASAFPAWLRQGRSAASEGEIRLCLTAAGLSAAVAGRAPRQAHLLRVLKASERGISTKELGQLGWDWRGPARKLIEQGWAGYRREESFEASPAAAPSVAAPEPNAAQRAAIVEVIDNLGGFRAFLLEGVTGSGKTEVYLRLVEEVLARGKQAMVLLPEINLTPQLEARFRARFSAPPELFHSGLGEAERSRAWLAMQRGKASILLGTRSAVFTPLARPGLIILDEEHDASFKQQEGFRFHARDVAVMRARRWGVPILMGSATPSLESLHNVRRSSYRRLALPERTGASAHPAFRLVDIRGQTLVGGLGPSLIAQVRSTLERGEQALLFLNRRGFAPTLICHACGWVAECGRCDARLVVHSAERLLRCHHCGHERALPRECPSCATADLRPLGAGTERTEQALAKLFPGAKTARVDRDSTRRKGSLEAMLEAIHAGEVDILLGTQMLAKGHHFPKVTLVGILDLDGGLFSLDFRAGERMAQLIVQVAGRAGREERPGLVLLQTRQPDHPLLNRLIRDGYAAFAEAALEERREAGMPPYAHQALWRAEAAEPESPARLLARLRTLAGSRDQVQVLGPAPAPMFRQAGRYRHQLLLQAATRGPLHECVDFLIGNLIELPEARRVRWSVDIDPANLY